MLNNKIIAILLVSLFVSVLSSCGGATNVSEPINIGDNTQAQLLSISITPADPQIAVNTIEKFTATGIYSDNTTQDLTASVTWSSSDSSVAMIGGDAINYAGSTTQNPMASTMYSPGHLSSKSSGRTTIWAHYHNVSGSTTITVTSATLISLTITPANPSIAKGTAQQFTVMGMFSDSTTQDLTKQVTWNSSNTGAATINAAGLATSVAAGSTTLTVVSGSITESSVLTVTPAALASIAVTPTNPSIAKGTSQQFTATGTYSDNTTQNLTTTVTWSSSNTGAATINASGLAASVATGLTTITAISGSISGSTLLTVNPATLVSLAVTPTNPSIAKGTAQQFKATGTFSDNTTQDLTASVTWSSDTGAVTVSNAVGSQGLATGSAAGSATITAASGSLSGSTSLTVTAATLMSITVTPVSPSIAKGTVQQFVATGTFSDSTTQNLTAAVTWSSSNTSVVSISNAAGSKGLATSVAAGSTTVTAISGTISGSTLLTVTPATLISIAVTPANPSIAKGTTRQFTATGTYSDNSMQNMTTAVTWSSSNTSVVSISNAAGSKGLATSVATGSTTLTATSGSISGTTTLTVTPATLVSIAITPVNPSIATGATQQFTATGTYSDSTTQSLTTAVTWGASNTAVASISNAAGSKGLATAVASGTTTITSVSGSISGTASLTVTSSGALLLTWSAPTTYSDGSLVNPATDISSYKIHYGTASHSYTQVVSVVNPGTSTISQTLTLSPGTYYFAVTAVDNSGQEGSYSNELLGTL